MNHTARLAISQKRRIAAYSVGVGIILTTLKLVVGLLTGSLAILSRVLCSFFDPGAATIPFFSIRISTQLLNQEHPYRHGEMRTSLPSLKLFTKRMVAPCHEY